MNYNRIMVTTVQYRYITTAPGVQGGEPIIRGTRTPVRTIVQYWQIGNTPDDIVIALPHLTLSQVFEAMSYYYDNQDEIDSLIETHTIAHDQLDKSVGDIKK